MPRVDRAVAGPQERLRHELEHVVGAVAEHDVVGADVETRRERGLERETVAVGIARELVGGVGDRLAHRGPGSARILVGRELDDRRGLEPEFARELVDRLARDVAGDPAHVLGGETRRVRRFRSNGVGDSFHS